MSNEMTAEQYRKMIGAPNVGLATLEYLTPVTWQKTYADSVTITVPGVPAYDLSPNSRAHWAKKASHSRAAKRRGYRACVGLPCVSGPVRIAWTVNLGWRRRTMDIDNMIVCLKPIQDAFVLAGIIDGDSPDIVVDVTLRQIIYSNHKSDPCIVAVIRKSG